MGMLKGWTSVRAQGEVFVIAIGRSSCGDTSEADLKKGWFWGSKGQPLGLPSLSNYDSTLTY